MGKICEKETSASKKYDQLKKKWMREVAARQEISQEMKQAIIVKGIPVFKKFGIHKAVIFG
ncbi:MAG TPA: hypothetical protein EYP63_03075 [Desulfotomaculum sp.]|nr:hypothetical protein [Desulfotomaculum sp.]